eukprot:TRINITY_DN10178_c0_g1_i2.p1 TRINITY_DN10178_c0_g1~~TRINITY_DN10178_c0_g1_i2.p1  ORF type:complete len:342 (+),score=57.24 TRINITY_DN10178_c0_g1_i2:206-1231(+)
MALQLSLLPALPQPPACSAVGCGLSQRLPAGSAPQATSSHGSRAAQAVVAAAAGGALAGSVARRHAQRQQSRYRSRCLGRSDSLCVRKSQAVDVEAPSTSEATSLPEIRPLRFFAATVPAEELAAALIADGCAVVEGLASPETMKTALTELSSRRLGEGQRHGPGTQLWKDPIDPASEPTVKNLAETPLLVKAAELVREAHAPGAASSLCWEIRWLDLPETDMVMALHRDAVDTAKIPLQRPLQWGFNAIWAATDFTEDNGSTRMIPGSHSAEHEQGGWGGDEYFAEFFAKKAVMPAGSVVIYYASVLHGSGANTTPATRTGLNFNYCYIDEDGNRPLGWF